MFFRKLVLFLFVFGILCGSFDATGQPIAPPGPLDSTTSLTPVFLAGRTVHPNTPDGIGSNAYLDQPSYLTACRGSIFFVDLRGLRSVDLQTRQVTTLIPGYTQFTPLWCDGNFLYSSSTANAGRLTIEQIDINTLQRSTFSYAATASYTRGRSEYVYGIGSTLFTTDSAAGRLWKIDLSTRSRSLILDVGGPLILPDPLSQSRPPLLYSVGAFWTDGSVLYILRPQPAGLAVNATALTTVVIDTGETTVLLKDSFSTIYGLGRSLYLGQASIQRFDLDTGQLTPFLSINAVIGWSDGESLYFSSAFPEGVIGKVNPLTKQISVLAGDLAADVDGIGSAARFDIYLLPGDMQIQGDSRFLYIVETGSLRRFDMYTGMLSTVVSNLSYARGLWTTDRYAYIADHFAIRRVDLTTSEIRTIAGSLTEYGNADGPGTDARFNNLGPIWGDGASLYISDNFGNAIRKLDLATGNVTTLVQGGGIYRGLWGMGRSLYVCDTRMVRRLDLDTLQFETIAGNGGPEGSADGVGTAAQFTRADGIWGDGINLFVTDAMRRIRRINLESRQVTTLYNSVELTSSGIFGDGSHLYLMEGYSLRRYDPESSTLTFATPGQGLSVIDVTPVTSQTLVHSNILFAAGTEVSGGTAIWGYRNPDGVLVSEAAVAAQAAIRNGRIYAETNASVRTGLAVSNPNDSDVRVDFYFTDAGGVDRTPGSFVLHAHEELARFLDEAPFSGGTINGTFTFNASAPLVAVSIRGLTNERSEFLITVLPLIDLDAALTYAARTIAHFASGGGWATQVLLINPTDNVVSGTLIFINSSGSAEPASAYVIPPRSSIRFVRTDTSASTATGSVLISPDAGSPSPTPLVIFGFAPAGITVTQTGVPAIQGTDFASYVESSGTSAPDMTDSGIAIANTSDQTIRVFLRLATSAGQPFGQNASLTLGPHAQVSKFISELFPTLQLPFVGVVHISSSTPISITGLRGRYNSRHEFIVATVTPMDKNSGAGTSPLYLPHLVTGGGYNTRLFLINPTGSWSTGTIQLLNADGSPFLN